MQNVPCVCQNKTAIHFLSGAPYDQKGNGLWKTPEPEIELINAVIISAGHFAGDDDTGVATKARSKTTRPPLYKVLLLNDDYTPMEFVIYVLERFFGISHQQSVDIMLTVHNKGLAVVGVFSFEIAETKVAQVMELARRNQHPLQCTMEKE